MRFFIYFELSYIILGELDVLDPTSSIKWLLDPLSIYGWAKP